MDKPSCCEAVPVVRERRQCVWLDKVSAQLQSEFVRLSNTDVQPVLPDGLVRPELGKLENIQQHGQKKKKKAG